jgi:hypothetical protein
MILNPDTYFPITAISGIIEMVEPKPRGHSEPVADDEFWCDEVVLRVSRHVPPVSIF